MDNQDENVFSFSIPAGVKEPSRTGNSGAFDLFMPCQHLLQPREVASIHTRVTYRLPEDTVGFVVPHPNDKGLIQILGGGFVGKIVYVYARLAALSQSIHLPDNDSVKELVVVIRNTSPVQELLMLKDEAYFRLLVLPVVDKTRSRAPSRSMSPAHSILVSGPPASRLNQ